MLAQKDSFVPTTPSTEGLPAYALAFEAHFPGSEAPDTGVEESHDW